jgi:4-hydroxy-tetrahydrodipicolinate reductase
MRVVLIGYGKMGRMIESLAPDAGIEIVAAIDDPTSALPSEFDVAIEFTEPTAVLGNVQRVAEVGADLVIGTTGWASELGQVKQIAEETGIGIVYAANFSVGVNLFERIVREGARQFADHPEYEAWAYEMHHSAKKDAPSGTLLHLVDVMRDAGYNASVDVASNRAGRVPGTHIIGFDSAADTITLTHTARNREGFARGALLAAKRVHGKPGLHKFSDLL